MTDTRFDMNVMIRNMEHNKQQMCTTIFWYDWFYAWHATLGRWYCINGLITSWMCAMTHSMCDVTDCHYSFCVWYDLFYVWHAMPYCIKSIYSLIAWHNCFYECYQRAPWLILRATLLILRLTCNTINVYIASLCDMTHSVCAVHAWHDSSYMRHDLF